MTPRTLIAVTAAALVLVLVPGTAAAAPQTSTTTYKNLTESFNFDLPACEVGAPSYAFVATFNLVVHLTVFDDGRVHDTFTETGKFTASPLDGPDLPSYTGSYTRRGEFNQNSDSVVTHTLTLSMRAKGSDGSRLVSNLLFHANTRPDGSVNQFFRCH